MKSAVSEKTVHAPLTQERLKSLLRYDKLTGVFTWIVNRGAPIRAGDIAGWRRPDGYLTIKIDGRKYRANRLAVLYVTGTWPDGEVDHKDTDPRNDKWRNLRDVTPRKNSQNQRHAHRDSLTGLLGVTWNASRGKYTSSIWLGDRSKYLGSFDDPNVAHKVFVEAKRKLHEGCTL